MKKYAFLAVAAIMLLTASAFVITNQSNSDSEATYWFLMDESGESVTTEQVSDPNDLCPDKLSDPDCARAYSESQTEINPVTGVRTVISSEVDHPIDFRSRNE